MTSSKNISSILSNRRNRKLSSNKSFIQNSKRLLLGFTTTSVFIFALGFIILGYLFTKYTTNLPSIEILPTLMQPPNAQLLNPTKIYDRTRSKLLYQFEYSLQEEEKYLILNDIPQNLINAFITANDPDFWDHSGFQFDNTQTLATILVKDLLLWNEDKRSTAFDIRTNLLAAQATHEYGKDQILEWYLNYVIMGQYITGIDEASWLYFGKSATQANLAESALLASISLAPEINPIENPNLFVEYQGQILQTMQLNGHITEEESQLANQVPISISFSEHPESIWSKDFINFAIDQLSSQISLKRIYYGGLNIISTLEYDLQVETICTSISQINRVTDQESFSSIDNSTCDTARLLPNLSESSIINNESISADVVIIDPENGQVLSMIGDPSNSYPPGTIISPFIYLTGFTREMNPASLLWDIPANIPPNILQAEISITEYSGPISLRRALLEDKLAPIIQTLTIIGPENVLTVLDQLGLNIFDLSTIDTPIEITTNSGQITLLEATHAYSILSNHGTLSGQPLDIDKFQDSFSPTSILIVEDSDGNVLLDWSQPQIRPITNSQMAYLITDILSDNNSRRDIFGHPNLYDTGLVSAVKTGQTINSEQTWAIGYSPQMVIGVRVGYNFDIRQDEYVASEPIDKSISLGLWQALFKTSHLDLPNTEFEIPIGLINIKVCDPSGLLPTTNCENIVDEIFIQGSEPQLPDNLYQTLQINKETGLLATVFTPPGLIVDEVFLNIPANASDWAEANNKKIPPSTYDIIVSTENNNGNIIISNPEIFSYISGNVTISGSVVSEDLNYFKIQVGEGLNPNQWLQIGEDYKENVSDGNLDVWDTTTGMDGLYAIQLIAVYNDQSIESSTIQVTIDNTPPSIQVLSPRIDQVLTYNNDFPITLQVNVLDNLGIESVNFSINGVLIKSLNSPPFLVPLLGEPGINEVVIIATDLAGNMSELTFQFIIEN